MRVWDGRHCGDMQVSRQQSIIRTSTCVMGFLASVAHASGEESTAAPAAVASSTATSDGLTEIVVTATKTGSAQLQKTPVAVSVVGGEFIADQGVSNIKDLLHCSR